MKDFPSVVSPRKTVLAADCTRADGGKRFRCGGDDYTNATGGTWINLVDNQRHPGYDQK